jgi:putative PIN family toxin of toxin-antitoxin system
MRLVLDTNVLVAALRSPKGASAALLSALREGRATMVANPALFLEYEATLKRAEHLAAAGLSSDQVDEVMSALALLLSAAPAGPLLRPLLSDPDDEMVLEAAVNGGADAVVTFETRTFAPVAPGFGIEVLTPGQACRRITS